MIRFYIDENTHEVHKSACKYCNSQKFVYLGLFEYCSHAVQSAKIKGYKNADSCYYCCTYSHTK